MDEGTPSYPDVSTGIDGAAALANAELGGIQGRPIEIRHCNVGVDQTTNQECAQEFANDDSVSVVINGYVAKQAADVDLLSGGRLRLGVGIGWNPVEYTVPGLDFTSRGRLIKPRSTVRLLNVGYSSG